MLTSEENKLVDTLKKSGKTNNEVMRIIATRRKRGITEANEFEPIIPKKPLKEKIGDVALGLGKGAIEAPIATTQLMQTTGQAILAAIDPTKSFDEIRKQTGFEALKDEQINELLQAKNPEEKLGKAVAIAGEILAGGGAGLIRKGVQKGGEIVESGVSKIASTFGKKANEIVPEINKPVGGIKQTVTEFAERVPRFVGRIKEEIAEAGQRAERIATSPKPVQNAIKVNLNDRVVNTIQQAEKPALNAYKEMIDIAEDTKGGTLKAKVRPEIVSGRAAEEEYKLIDKKRNEIGKQIGEVVDTLSKKDRISMLPSTRTLNHVLTQNGITPVQTAKGVKIDYTGTAFTPQERTKIDQLYQLATEGGETLTPRQIYNKDKLFSKLQREARLEGIGDIIVNTSEGDMNLFRVFRDTYANQLDEIAPQIKNLNKEYRKYITLQDDIENSIIKSGKFETSKGVSDAEFAQTNLRRLDSDALSAADYRAIVSEMDKVARELGYAGANPEDLALFARELRDIYPETMPKNSFSGGIKSGIRGILENITDIGAPNQADKQKALRELIDSLLSEATQ